MSRCLNQIHTVLPQYYALHHEGLRYSWTLFTYFLDWHPALLFLIKQKGKVLKWAQISLSFCLLCWSILFLKQQSVYRGRNIVSSVAVPQSTCPFSLHTFIHSFMRSLILVSKYFWAHSVPGIVLDARFQLGAKRTWSWPCRAHRLSWRQTWTKYLHEFIIVNRTECYEQKV